MTGQIGGYPELLKVIRHGQSCTNIMGSAYALLVKEKNPYILYGDNNISPKKTQLSIWSYLSNISQDPPLNNGGLCDLIDLYNTSYKTKERPNKVYCSF